MNNVTQIDFNIAQLRPYINWLYFYHAWGLAGKPQSEKDKLLNEANAMLDRLQQRYQTHALVGLFDANADGDDIVVGTERMPMLRQQRPSAPGAPYLCLADFVRPLSSGIKTDWLKPLPNLSTCRCAEPFGDMLPTKISTYRSFCARTSRAYGQP